MALEIINIGASPNDGQGDPIRTAFEKSNINFGNLWARAQENPPATLVGTTGDFAGMYAYDSNYFYYCFGDYDGSTVIWAQIPNTVIDAIEIANGNSAVRIPTANGNVNVSVANTANLAVFTSSGAIINGDLTVTGNATLSGNIVGDRIVNGTTSIEIPTAGGNATISVAGTSNVAIYSSNTVTMAANVLPGSNLVYSLGSTDSRWQDLWLANSSIYMGNIVLGSVDSVLTVNGANVLTGNAGTNFSITGNVTGGNLTTTGMVTATGNVTGGNVLTTGLISAAGNVQGGNLITTGVIITTGNIQGSNLFTSGSISVNGNVIGDSFYLGQFSGNVDTRTHFQTTNITSNAFSFVGVLPGANNTTNLCAGWAAFGSADSANSSIIGIYNDTANVKLWSTALGTANVRPLIIKVGNIDVMTIDTNGNVGVANANPTDALTVAGNAYVSGNVTANNFNALGAVSVAGNITTSGGIFIGNGSGLTGVVATGNVGAASQLTNGTTSLNIPVADGNIIGNISGTTNLFEFSTVGLSAAGNVTANNLSAGNLISAAVVSVSGNITSSGGVFVGNGAGLVNVIANVGSASQLTSGTTEINIPVASGNIVANVGGSTNLFQWSTVGFSAVGNITGGNLRTGGLISATGNITGGNLSVTNIAGTLTTATQTNITSVGTLTSLNSGAISSSGNVTGDNLLTGGIVSASGNITGGNLSGTNISGTLVTATQTNITSVGTLTSLNSGAISSSGNVTGTNLITAGLLSVNSGNTAGAVIVNAGGNGTGNIGSATARFNTVHALATSAQYADLAEYYLSDEHYQPGTVVSFGGSQEVTRCDVDHDVSVAGIVSARPAFEMNAGLEGANRVALALAGRVHCQVEGPVRRGQMLVSSGQGRGRAESQPQLGAVIGKALQDFDGEIGVIEVVVGRL